MIAHDTLIIRHIINYSTDHREYNRFAMFPIEMRIYINSSVCFIFQDINDKWIIPTIFMIEIRYGNIAFLLIYMTQTPLMKRLLL